MMKMTLFVKIMAFVLLMAQSCEEKEDCHRNIKVVNNSDKDIWIGESGLQHNGLNCQQIPGLIRAGESYNLDLLRVCWETRITNTYQGAVIFHFFHENYFDTHSVCDPVEFNQSAIERREYTVADLNALHWVVEYK